MKLVSFEHDGHSGWGVVDANGVIDVSRRLDGRFASLRAAIAADALDDVARAAAGAAPDHDLSAVRLLPPIPDPEKIVCAGFNYRAHVSEGGGKIPDFPSLFTRFANTLVAHDAPVVVPRVSGDVDYECELALVIGKPGRHIAEADALAHVAGYSCFNDVSVRDYQFDHSLAAGKNFAGTAPFGPWLVTPDEFADPGKLSIRTLLNGVELQHGNTCDLIFGVAALISYISDFTPLVPGDVISTGTPEGVGFARTPPIWLKPGDVVEIEVEGIGTLRNPVVAEPD
jgi:2-keto-4-pentenoate hydratase/2-oxohepta-3-ene-1,7-dioic acid hydratase in catechol pathway